MAKPKPPRGVRQGTKRAPYATKKIETVTINFRVPKENSEACKDFVRPLLKEFLNKKKIKTMSAYEGSKMQERDEDAGKKITFGKNIKVDKPKLKRDIVLRELKCPICQKVMQTRIINSVYINKTNKNIAKGKHYQYYCLVCDTEDTGWTSTQSDELSLNL